MPLPLICMVRVHVGGVGEGVGHVTEQVTMALKWSTI